MQVLKAAFVLLGLAVSAVMPLASSFADCTGTPSTQCDGFGGSFTRESSGGVASCPYVNQCFTETVADRTCRYYDACGNVENEYQDEQVINYDTTCHTCGQ